MGIDADRHRDRHRDMDIDRFTGTGTAELQEFSWALQSPDLVWPSPDFIGARWSCTSRISRRAIMVRTLMPPSNWVLIGGFASRVAILRIVVAALIPPSGCPNTVRRA